MDTTVILVNDEEHALPVLQAALLRPATRGRFVVLACPPRLARYVGKWLTHRQRETWRRQWSDSLFRALQSAWAGAPRGTVVTDVVVEPLPQCLARLREQHGESLQVVDARKPRDGDPAAKPSPATAPSGARRWAAPLSVASGLSAVLAITD